MSLSNQAKPRQRRRQFAPKARTGCGTCKSRRVKCGEERPHCHRCQSTGRLCDGYDTIRLAQTSTDSAGAMVLRWVQPLSQAPATDPRENEAFLNFREGLIDSLCSTWDMDVWYRLVLPMSTQEPVVRHALVALGALSRSGDVKETFGLQQYGLAMKDLQSKIASDDRPARALILVTCLLFVAIEFVQHGFDQAQFHLSGGLSMVKEIRQDPNVWRGESSSKSDLARLEQLFGRLDNQMSLYTSSRVRLQRAMENGRMACLPAELRFRSIEDAGTLQSLQVAAMRELVVEVESQRFGPNGITPANYMELEAQLGRQVISLDRWHTAMQDFLPGIRHPPEKRLAKLLSMSYLCCRMMVLNALSEGREVYHDRYIAEFEQILALGTELLPPTVGQQCTARRLFSLETGIVAPLYYTVLKCRDPRLRRQAIACIRLSNSQEGAWNSSRVATLAERVVKVEEQDLDNPQSAADIPERNRLWRAWFDTQYGANTLFCKRRAWEQNGEWIEYEIRFG